MGVWHTSLVVPQMIATPIAGRVLDTIKKNSGAHDAYAKLRDDPVGIRLYDTIDLGCCT